MKSSENIFKIDMDAINYELIVAMNKDGIIGITDASGNQRLAFNCREDMRFFREMTTLPEGHILVMGRKTFESLPNSRPLPGRIHIVLSRVPRKYDEKYITTNDVYFTKLENLDEVLGPLVYPYSNKRVFVCGGEEIYRALLPRCERLYITHILSQIELNPGETTSRFSYSETEFEEIESKVSIDKTCVFKTLERISPKIESLFCNRG